MNKKLLTLLLFVMAAFTAAFAQETVTVYDGTNTNTYVPVYGTWADAYNKCEFVMNANDLGDLPAGAIITGLTWYFSSAPAAAWGGNFQIFIKEIDATTLSAFTGTDGATVVWEGALDGTSGEINLEFNNYYTYEGGNLLIGVYQTEKGTYKTSAFYGVSTDGASVSGYSSSALESCSATQRNFVPKTTFTYTPGGGVVYSKPKNLQISNITTNGAVATWEAGGEETAWNLEYKKTADEEWTAVNGLTTTTYTFDALANGTAYDVRVQADYGEGQSGWLPTSFTTLTCEDTDKGEVTFILTDSYGDRWSSSEYLQIVYNGTVVETINWPSTSESKTEYTGTVNLCYGVNYDLVWVGNGSYTYECGFKLIAPDGSVIYEHVGGTNGNAPTPGTLTTFSISQVSCPRPTALAASNVVYNGATLTWTPGDEEQDAWEVVYGANGFNPDEATPVAVTGEATYTITGLTENTAYQAYVRGNCGNDKSNWSDPVAFTTPLQFALPSELAVDNITAKSAVATWTGDAESYNLRYRKPASKEIIFSDDFENGLGNWTIYTDGEAPETEGWYAFNAANSSLSVGSHSGDYVASAWSWSSSAYDANNWLITPQVALGGEVKFWVTTAGSWPDSYEVLLSTTDNTEESFTVTLQAMATAPTNNEWNEVVISLADYADQTGYIAIHHVSNDCNYLLIDDFSIEGDDIAAGEWITIENATSPQDIEGLDPLTEYEVQVQGVYADGTSQWTESVLFTTLSALDTPTELAVANITENSAEASWEGVQDSYNLRYRKAATADVLFFEGFEEGLDAWTLVDSDGDGNNWMLVDPENTFSNSALPRYEGTYCVMSRSYSGSALTPDQWMISPKIDDLGGMLRYYVMDDGANYPETYRIYVSTTDTEIDSFTAVTEDMQTPNSINWTEQSVDLSAYEGQSGYIAFRHYNCTDKDFMFIDAIGIYKNEVPAGEWIVVENAENPYTIEDLEAATDYEVEVQGIFGEETTEWTAPVKFTTLEAEETGINEFYIVGAFNDWNQTEDGGRITLEDKGDGVFEGTVTLEAGEAGEFKIITFNEDGSTKWFGGVDEANVGYFLINEGTLNINISLVDGKNFRPEEAGNYTIQVMEAPTTTGLKGINEPLVMKVVKNDDTGINSIGVDGYDNNAWYNLNGQKLNGKPTVPGIYINGNKKVVVR